MENIANASTTCGSRLITLGDHKAVSGYLVEAADLLEGDLPEIYRENGYRQSIMNGSTGKVFTVKRYSGRDVYESASYTGCIGKKSRREGYRKEIYKDLPESLSVIYTDRSSFDVPFRNLPGRDLPGSARMRCSGEGICRKKIFRLWIYRDLRNLPRKHVFRGDKSTRTEYEPL